jgi:hypothetical protein
MVNMGVRQQHGIWARSGPGQQQRILYSASVIGVAAVDQQRRIAVPDYDPVRGWADDKEHPRTELVEVLVKLPSHVSALESACVVCHRQCLAEPVSSKLPKVTGKPGHGLKGKQVSQSIVCSRAGNPRSLCDGLDARGQLIGE